MFLFKSKIIFNNFISFFFDFFSNYFFVKFFNYVLFFKMPRFFFFFKTRFFFFRKFDLTSFLAHLTSVFYFFFSFFFVRFKMRGLGYRVKHITNNIIRFFIGTTNFYYFVSPVDIYIKARRRKLLLVSTINLF